MINKQSLIPFLIKAKKSTYAGKGAESQSSRPASHDLQFREGNYLYIDSYIGGEKFSGEEAVWDNETPIWAMNYSGRVTNNHFSGDFLKEALLHVSEEYPYRGPLFYSNAGYRYQCTIRGDFEWFQGSEEIFYNGVKIYECYFHGGIVV